jgi:hypothetical protein
MRKPLILALAGVICLMLAGYFVHRALTRSPIDRAAYDRIHEGMPLQEVQELIGVPPGEYGARSRRVEIAALRSGSMRLEEEFWRLPHEVRHVGWSSDKGEITVAVSLADDKIVGKMFYEREYDDIETPTNTLLRWFGFPQARSEIVIID